MTTNHAGAAAIAIPAVRLSSMDLGVKPVSFELLCVRVVTGSSACVLAVVYRPGSDSVKPAFFDELAEVLDRLVTFVDPVFLVGDINIRLERTTDPATCQFSELLAAYGLMCRVTAATHYLGGTLDVVVIRQDMSLSVVEIFDVCLSDHRLLRWSVSLARPRPVYTTATSRPWCRLDAAKFSSAVSSLLLCQPDAWSTLDVDGLARLFDTEMTAIVDRLIPIRNVRCRRRASDPWFDDDCRAAKRSVRLFERRARQAAMNDATAAAAAWRDRRRTYRQLLETKQEAFWQSKITAERSSPRALWQSIDKLLGREHSPLSSAVDADKKVATVRESTADAPSSTFSTVPFDSALHNFRLLTMADIITAVRLLPDKHCMSDPLLTRVLKEHIGQLAPLLVELFNRS